MTFDRTRVLSAPGALFRTRLYSREKALELAPGFLLACGAFALYIRTLVPSVLDGDQGEFQFIPAILGIPHPSGFPLYILLGHVWSLLPLGTLAYRMNLLSAFFGALTIGALYLALRFQKLSRFAAFAASVTLAVIPQFWEYSTVAAVYRLHDFLFVLVFAFLSQWERTKAWRWLELAALAFGLDLANHLTIVFLAPATLLLLLMVAGRSLFKQPRVILIGALLLLSPLLLYAYFPIRGSQLISSSFALPGWNMAVAQGVVSPFYDGSPGGLFQYFVGGTFFKSVTGNWQWRWDTLLSDWANILLETVNWQVLVLSLIGALVLLKSRPKLAVWLLVVVGTFQLLALQYTYEGLASIGQFSSYFREYYLPSFIALVILAAWGMDGTVLGVRALASRFRAPAPQVAYTAATIALAVFVLVAVGDLVSHRSGSLAARSAEIQAKWETVKNFPPEQDAALVGHWGDLTPFWYFQYADNWRPDLLTINPPDESRVDAWMATGKPLYLAGALLDWAPGIVRKYHLTPWGPLVRVTRNKVAPPSPFAQKTEWTFANDQPLLRLSGYQVSKTSLRVGEGLQVDTYWQALSNIKVGESVVYLSLKNSDDDTRPGSYPPVVNWLPGGQMLAGQRALAVYDYMVPWGTRPGSYNLVLSLYSIGDGMILSATQGDQGATSITIGQVQVQPPLYYPDTAETDHPANANFGNRVTLLGWNGELGQVTTGNTPNLRLLWKVAGKEKDDMTAALSLDNSSGSHPVGEQPVASNYPTSRWQPGEVVLGNSSFTVPADLPDGDYALVLRLHAGSATTFVGLYAGWIPMGDSVVLGHLRVVGRKHSFAIPQISHPQPTNFQGRLSMLGYDISSPKLTAGDSLHLRLFWQGQSVMSQSYKFFVHVVDGDGHLLAQYDGIPGGNTLPTTGWLPQEVVTDSFDISIPEDAAAGLYQVQIGFYDAVTGTRLNVTDAHGASPRDYAVLNDALEVTAK